MFGWNGCWTVYHRHDLYFYYAKVDIPEHFLPFGSPELIPFVLILLSLQQVMVLQMLQMLTLLFVDFAITSHLPPPAHLGFLQSTLHAPA